MSSGPISELSELAVRRLLLLPEVEGAAEVAVVLAAAAAAALAREKLVILLMDELLSWVPSVGEKQRDAKMNP